jgi:hypothetical protein
MKTPEELAEEYGKLLPVNNLDTFDIEVAFLAGYQAAQHKDKAVNRTYLAWKLAEDYGAVKWLKHKDYKRFGNTERDYEYTIARDGFYQGYQAAAPQWISVKDRLPEDHKHYLVISNVDIVQAPVWYNGCPYWDVELAYYSQRYERWMTEDPTLKDVPKNKVKFEVTYWMPLPAAPEEEA